MSERMVKFDTSEAENYYPEEQDGHYLKAFDDDRQGNALTVLVRDDHWTSSDGEDYLAYHTAAVAISREDAVTFAKWVLERFDTE